MNTQSSNERRYKHIDDNDHERGHCCAEAMYHLIFAEKRHKKLSILINFPKEKSSILINFPKKKLSILVNFPKEKPSILVNFPKEKPSILVNFPKESRFLL